MCHTYSVKISTPSSPRIERSLSVIDSCNSTVATSISSLSVDISVRGIPDRIGISAPLGPRPVMSVVGLLLSHVKNVPVLMFDAV